MINLLPRWVELGGFLLAINAGFINAIGLLGFEHNAVSHLTGTSTFFSLAIATHNLHNALHLLLIMLSFIVGAAYSGLVIGHSSLKLGRRYSTALITESLLLLIGMLLLDQGSVTGHYFASAACGLQNALTTTYSGAIIRSTHVTGLFTDLGLALGLRLRGQKSKPRQIMLYLILITGFISGGIVGAIGFMLYQFTALLLPSLMTAVMAMLYWIYVQRQRAQQTSQ